ncbi:hypothetical protein B566_EDAN015476 [Ephemera danica]|nr:hypothetical protein B566_EDAN015476 [Ephemera danica]
MSSRTTSVMTFELAKPSGEHHHHVHRRAGVSNKVTVIGSQLRPVVAAAALRRHHQHHQDNNMVEVSTEGELARAAARASDGGPVSGTSERSDGQGNAAQQQQSSSPTSSLSNGPSTTNIASPAPCSTSSPRQQQQPSPSTGPASSPSHAPPSNASDVGKGKYNVYERSTPVLVVEEATVEIKSPRQSESAGAPPPLTPTNGAPSQQQQQQGDQSRNHESTSPRSNPAPPQQPVVPPPLVRSRHASNTSSTSLNYPRQLGAVSERVSTMANNASNAFDSGVQRLQQQRISMAPKLLETSNNVNLKSQQLQPPVRQPTAPAPVPAPHPNHQRLSQQQPTYKQPMPPLQKPVRPLPMRAYNSTPTDYQTSGRDTAMLNKSPTPQRPSFHSQQPNQQDVREFIATSNHHISSGPGPPSRPSIRVLEEISRKVDRVPSQQTVAERTRNGASIQEVTRELSDLVRFPSSGAPRHRSLPPHELRQHQQMQLNAAAEDVERSKKEYEVAYRHLMEARDRLNRAQQVLDHHQSLAEATVALQAEQRQRLHEQRHQEQHAALSQPTLANLLLSDPPQKRMRMEHSSPAAASQPTHSSPPSAPPAPQHLMSPQLPQSRNGRSSNERPSTEETPMDLSHARPPWQPPAVEEIWRAASSPTTAPPFSITILTPPDVPPVPVIPVSKPRPVDNQYYSHIRHKKYNPIVQDQKYNVVEQKYVPDQKYNPIVDPVSPPRPPEHTPSPPLVLSRPSPTRKSTRIAPRWCSDTPATFTTRKSASNTAATEQSALFAMSQNIGICLFLVQTGHILQHRVPGLHSTGQSTNRNV